MAKLIKKSDGTSTGTHVVLKMLGEAEHHIERIKHHNEELRELVTLIAKELTASGKTMTVEERKAVAQYAHRMLSAHDPDAYDSADCISGALSDLHVKAVDLYHAALREQ